jgi:PAS domain S-box-containing protein
MHFIFRLRWRLLAITLLIAFPAFILIYLSNVEQRQLAAERAQDDALALVRSVAAQQDQFIAETRVLLTTLAQMPQIHPEQRESCNANLAELSQGLPYHFIGVAKTTGEVVCGSPEPQSAANIADRLYFQRALASRYFTAGDFQLGRSTGQPILVFAAPIFRNNDTAASIQGVIIASIELTWLQQEIAKSTLPTDTTVTLFDQSGIVLAHYPDQAWIGRTLPAAHPLLQKVLHTTGEGAVEAPGFDNTARLTAFMRLPSLPATAPLYITVGVPTSVAYAHANEVWRRNLLVLILGTLVMGALAWAGNEFLIRRRINSLLQATKQLATGDLSTRVQAVSNDELGELAQTFNQMAASLQTQVEETKRAEAEKSEIEHLRAEEFRALTEHAPDLICRYDRDLRYLYINSVITRIAQIPPEFLIGKSNREIGMPENEVQPLEAGLRHVFTTGEETTVVFQVTTATETATDVKTFEARMIPEFASNGEVEMVMSISRDITAVTAAERALRASEERFRLLAENAQDIIYQYDIKETRSYVYVSPSLTRITGYTPEEFYADFDLG